MNLTGRISIVGIPLTIWMFLPGTPAAAQGCIEPAAEVVSWWPFDDGTAEDIIDSNDGILLSGTPAPGMVAGALSFFGTDNRIDIPDNPNLRMDNPFTVEGWIRLASPGTGVPQMIIYKGGQDFLVPIPGGSACPCNYNLQITGDGHALFNVRPNYFVDGVHDAVVISAVPIIDDTFHHIAGVYDGEKILLYVDGALAGEDDSKEHYFQQYGVVTSPDPVNIGYHDHRLLGPIGFLEGIVDEITIYDRALSGAEIAAIFASGNAGKCKHTELAIASDIPAAESETVDVGIDFTSGGRGVAATAFSIDYDESCLDFDDTDADPIDGIPDAIDLQVPADFNVTVFHDLGDEDGEIDVSIVDFTPPVATLPDGPLITATFTAACSPAPGATITAPVAFSADPSPSFAGNLAGDIAGGAVDGSVTIHPGPRGDCNGNGELAAADLVAVGLEIFDGDGAFWADVPGGAFDGSLVGCDANADTAVDAGDVSCAVLRIFGDTCSSSSRLAWRPPAVLRIDGTPRFKPGKPLHVPVRFESRGHGVSSLAFSLDLETRHLRFDPADFDRNGVPDSVRFPTGAPALTAVRFDRDDRDGELDVMLALAPGSTFEDGLLLEIELVPVRRGRAGKALRFSDTPEASFGGLGGESVPGQTVLGHGGALHR